MNYGGEESVKEARSEESKKKSRLTSSRTDEFVQFITRIAVAQVCGSIGFQSFHQSALDTLSDVAVRYIGDIGKTSSLSANLAGRTECNVFDVIHGLADLGSVQGFSGCSDVHRCLLGSGMVKDIVEYVEEVEELPFAFAVPEFPVVKDRKLNASFVQRGENPPGEHIPAWLPVFPDPESYADKQLRNEKEGESKVDRMKWVDEHKKIEKSLLSFQNRLACNGSEVKLVAEAGDAVKEKRAVESNPFLAPPLPSVEKAVSLVVPPAKLSGESIAQNQNHLVEGNHSSVLEAFGPAFEGVKSKQSDTEEWRQAVISERGSLVQFKLGSGRKILHKAMNVQNESFERITSWFSNNNTGKDEKKRRADAILKESMECPEQLDHL